MEQGGLQSYRNFPRVHGSKKENLSNSEYSKAVREVNDIAIGRYEQAQKRGNSMKL